MKQVKARIAATSIDRMEMDIRNIVSTLVIDKIFSSFPITG